MTIRVLHVSQPTEAGVAVCAHRFSADQMARSFDVLVACPAEGDLASWLRDDGIPHARWEASRSPGPSAFSEARSLARIADEFRPDVVHLHSSKAGLAGRMGKRRASVVVFQPHAWSFEAVSGPIGSASLMWERYAARRSDAIVCVSDAERERGRESGIRADLRVIPNGVDLERWPAAGDAERARARADLGLGDGPLAVCVGRLSRQKAQDVLLMAWPQVSVSVPQASLVLVGDGPERSELEDRRVEGVTFAGNRTDVPRWLAAADVVVMPSRWEGMSLAMLEAMATARPLVATAVAGATEALAEGGGAVVPVEDPDALAHAISERLNDKELAATEGRAARRRVEEVYDFRITANSIAKLYEELRNRQPNS